MLMMSIKRVVCLGGLTALLVTGCATTQTTSGGTVGVERGQAMLLSSSEVNRSAATAYKSTIDSARSKGLLNRDPRQYERVRRIAHRLIPATATFRNDAPSWPWEVNVITAKEVNAWCMPGGKMAVYTGLIEQLQITDDELAAVMGHEIAHALREHGREKASQAAGVNVAAAIGGAVIGTYFGVDARLGQTALGAVGDLAFMRPNSREMEQEADRVGVELAARAGYDPSAAITLWQKMGQVSSGNTPQWLSTHPSNQARIADLRVYAQRVQPLYVESRRGH